MAGEQRKMSLVATYDDLCRFNAHLTEGIEDQFIKFAQSIEEWRKKFLSSQLEVQRYQLLLKGVQAEKSALEANLAHARKAIEMEMKRRSEAEQERDSFECQIALIRELLVNDRNALNDQTREKLAFLNGTLNHPSAPSNDHEVRRLDTIDESSGSMISSSDISYDKTDENIEEVGFIKARRAEKRSVEGRISEGRRRPSAPPLIDVTPPKRNRNEDAIDSLIATTTVEIPVDGVVTAKAVIETKSKNRSYIEPISITSSLDSRLPMKSDVGDIGFNVMDVRTTPKNAANWISRQTSATKLNARSHDFCTKTIIKPEMCMPCGKRIKFGKPALKCKDCKAVCHPDCKEQVPLPCVPTVNTPSSRGFMGTIADFTPLTFPMVPAIVIHSINEVEARGLNEVGIYRVPGSEKEVKELKEKFLRGKGVPNLTRVDIHVICGCMKDFLRSLKEPLLTNTLWKDFVNAAEINDDQDSMMAVYQAISQLPTPNRDTLAYLILHLQKVADCPECKMPASNLARIFGPTIVGYSSLDPEPSLMISETKKQAAVMEQLLNIPSDYWSNFINVNNSNFLTFTPEINDKNQNRRTSLGNRASNSNKGKGYVTLTPLAARSESASKTKATSKRSRNFFSSPMLK